MDGPLTEARKRLGLTQQQLALEASIHPQAVFLAEQAVYPTILPKLARFFENEGLDIKVLEAEYRGFQRAKRERAGRNASLALYQNGAPDLGVQPFVSFRDSLGMSRMRFAKSFCVHPASLYNLEHGSSGSLPEQLRIALDEAGLGRATIDELEERCREFHRGEWVAKPAV